MDFRVLQLVLQTLGNAEIVDAPPCIFGSGAEAVGPPGVDSLLIRIKIPEGVNKARSQKVREFSSLLVGKSGVFSVGVGVILVNLLVGFS